MTRKNFRVSLQVASALLATFLGGFLFASAATVSFTVDGESTTQIAIEQTHSFVVQVTSGAGESVLGIGVYLEKTNKTSFPEISNISCGTAENDFSGDFFDVECVWDEGFEGTETISFDAVISEIGDYALGIETTNSNPDFDLHEFFLTAEEANVPFTFDSAATRDLDANGNIDALKLTFSADVDVSSASVGDISVDGYTVSSVSAWDGDTTALKVVLEEGSSPDTDAVPSVTVSGISNTEAEEVSETTRTAADESSPVMVSGIIAEDGSLITVTFSEDVNGQTVGSLGTDFSLSENTITGADETSPGIVTLTLGSTTASETIDVTVGEDVIDDLNGRPTISHTITATEAPDETPITIESIGLSTSATSTDAVISGDTIALTFSLAEQAATTTVLIMGDTVVDIAAEGTTYTATYTVSPSTATGTVAFSLSVLDEAGNESTASAVTDGSSLTIIETPEDPTISYTVSLSADATNLISLPVSPEDTSIASVVASISGSLESVWTYIDGSWFVYYPDQPTLSNLTTMDAGYAYFVTVSSDTTLSGEGLVQEEERTLSGGWQLVGYLQPDAETTGTVSIDTAFAHIGLAGVAYTSLLKYENGSQLVAEDVSLGEGFWMNVAPAADTSMAPSIPHQLYGTAPNFADTTLTASVAGTGVGSIGVQSDASFGTGNNLFFIEDANNAFKGETISFSISGTTAANKVTFAAGGLSQLTIAPQTIGSGSSGGGGGGSIISIPTPEPVRGDLNGDGVVDIRDFTILMAAWGTPGGDLNNDGVTDILDFTILMAHWT